MKSIWKFVSSSFSNSIGTIDDGLIEVGGGNSFRVSSYIESSEMENV